MLDFLFEPAFWASLVLLIGIEVALGAENVRLMATSPALSEEQRRRTIQTGMAIAAAFRLILLAGVVWILELERAAFVIGDWAPSWREVILFGGGLFLIYKAVSELYLLVEQRERTRAADVVISESPSRAIVQIVLVNALFSVDSVITAVGLTTYVQAMVIALITGMVILYLAAGQIGQIIARHPSIKAVALGFVLIVGVVLIAEGLGGEIERSYLYTGMGFSVLVLAGAKLISSQASEPVAHTEEPLIKSSPVTPPTFERAEPRIEPDMEEPQSVSEPQLEPAFASEPALNEQEEEVPIESEPEIPDVEMEIPKEEHKQIHTDERILGEDDNAVQKSRRKRPIVRRRPERLRTSRRRE